MKKYLLASLLCVSLTYHSQAFSEGFEGDLSNWSVINNGSDDPNEQWGIWGYYFALLPHSGNYMAGIQYSDNASHDDYLITPKFTVTQNISDKLSFYAVNYSSYFPETLDILVSESTLDAASFTEVLASNLAPNTGTWTQYSYDLTPYIGKDIYIAFHSTTFYLWFVAIDDVEVSGNTLAVSDSNKKTVSVYPNPFNDVLKISDTKDIQLVSISDISGKLVKELNASSELNLSELKSGLYIVSLKMKDGTIKTQKIIKK